MDGTMFMSVKDAAKATGLSYDHMLEISKRADAPTLPVGRCKSMFLASELESYMAKLVHEHIKEKKEACHR